jgi:hypothetical protein
VEEPSLKPPSQDPTTFFYRVKDFKQNNSQAKQVAGFRPFYRVREVREYMVSGDFRLQ